MSKTKKPPPRPEPSIDARVLALEVWREMAEREMADMRAAIFGRAKLAGSPVPEPVMVPPSLE